MAERIKVVLIGAGSAVFTQGLVADFILSHELGPLALALVDIDSVTLDAITAVVNQMVRLKGADILVESSTDRRQVLREADVVVATIAVGGRRAWEQDVFIPRKYGIFQPVGDTTMPGGISRALRMIPAMLEIARDVQELCPKALFINYSNPMTAICTAIQKVYDIPVIGLCHGVTHVEEYLARFMGVDATRVTSIGVGLNHLTFLYDIRVDGQDAHRHMHQVLQEQYKQLPAGNYTESLGAMGPPAARPLYCDEPFSWHFYQRFGAFPAVLDRHVTEFFPERFATGDYHGKTLGVDAYPFEQVVAHGDEDHQYLLERAAGTRDLDDRLFQRTSGEHEKLVEILQSMRRDERKVFYANVRNAGAVPNLPPHAVLEIPTIAAARGFHPFYIPDFPERLASIVRKRLTVVDLTVEAALTGNPDMVVEALLADGSVRGEELATQLATELLEAHRVHVPHFFAANVSHAGSALT